MSEITVRPAKIKELVDVYRLFSEVLNALPYYNSLAKKHELQKYVPLRLQEKISQDPYSVLIAVDNSGDIIGFCFNHFDDFTVWIDWFGVKATVRSSCIYVMSQQWLQTCCQKKIGPCYSGLLMH
ncbi:MAG: hypothetical protein QXG39_01510 [Candidatus Aenigmatarchaeota archaeon]